MKRSIINQIKLTLPSLSQNESFARSAAAAFMSQCDPTVQEIGEIKTAVSEAVTNAIVHGYRGTTGDILMLLKLYSDNTLYIAIKDKGAGIDDIGRAMTPMFTTAPEEERSGLGFSVMESFTDKLKVKSTLGKGTTVIMEKRLKKLDP